MKSHLKFAAAAAVALAACAATSAWAQGADWRPSKPVRIIVPIVGSTNDVLARLIGPELQKAFGQPFVVENKPGAGGNIGALEVARSAPDGHTLLIGYNGPLAINVTLFDKMPYDPVKDLAPITLAVKSPQYLVVNPAAGIADVKDFIAKAKANPAQYSYGSVAMGSASHLTMEMMKSAAGFHMTHIPYRGAGPALQDLIAGNVDMMFDGLGSSANHIKGGRIKALMVSGNKRSPAFPDVPCAAELGLPEYTVTTWYGIWAPKGTPADKQARAIEEIRRACTTDEAKAVWASQGADFPNLTGAQFGAFVNGEIRKWALVVKASGAKLD